MFVSQPPRIYFSIHPKFILKSSKFIPTTPSSGTYIRGAAEGWEIASPARLLDPVGSNSRPLSTNSLALDALCNLVHNRI